MKKIVIFISFFSIILFIFSSINAGDVFAVSCSKIGSSTYCSDGTSYTQIGNSLYGSDGSSYNTIGNTTYGSGGSSCTKIGSSTYCSDGTSYTQIGNSLYGSDGSSYNRIGSTIYGSGGSSIISSCSSNSSYDSLSGKCKCRYGYVVGASGQCVSGSSYCYSKIGLMSQYDSLSNTCKCMVGYEFNGSSCVYKKKNYSNTPTLSTLSNCPLNSHASTALLAGCTSTSGFSVTTGARCSTGTATCQCDLGYQVNSTKTACVIAIPSTTTANNQACSNAYGLNSIWDGTKTATGLLNCGCQTGYSWNITKTTCVITINSTLTANNQACVNAYGLNSIWDGTKTATGLLNCGCKTGYQWNQGQTQCVLL